MKGILRPFRAPATYRGWAHALTGPAVAAPFTLVAVAVLASAWPGAPGPVLAAAFAPVCLLGLPRAARRACIRIANGLLGTGLPRPTAARRWGTVAWFLVWVLGGGVLVLVSLSALVLQALPVVWLSGGGTVTVVADVAVPGGALGVWTVPVAAAGLLAWAHLSALYTDAMRRLGRLLLGPGLSERLAAAEAEADRAAARNRLARDLHDSIGHTLTASTIQAAVAKQVFEADPETARRAMASIEDSSRSALDDLDRALGVLRDEPVSGREQSSLADLELLVERVALGGVDIAVEVDGDTGEVTSAVSREAYRIVQEGVTNALRHAPGSAVRLRIDVSDASLALRVRNTVAAQSVPGAGFGRGLTGISERARLLGGTASAGPDGEGHWTLRAELPLRANPEHDRAA